MIDSGPWAVGGPVPGVVGGGPWAVGGPVSGARVSGPLVQFLERGWVHGPVTSPSSPSNKFTNLHYHVKIFIICLSSRSFQARIEVHVVNAGIRCVRALGQNSY